MGKNVRVKNGQTILDWKLGENVYFMLENKIHNAKINKILLSYENEVRMMTTYHSTWKLENTFFRTKEELIASL